MARARSSLPATSWKLKRLAAKYICRGLFIRVTGGGEGFRRKRKRSRITRMRRRRRTNHAIFTLAKIKTDDPEAKRGAGQNGSGRISSRPGGFRSSRYQDRGICLLLRW